MAHTCTCTTSPTCIYYYCSYLQSQVPRVLVLGADVRGVGVLDSWIDGSLPLGVPTCFWLSVVCWWRDCDGVSCGVVSWCGYTWRNHKHCQQGAVTLHVHACACIYLYIHLYTYTGISTDIPNSHPPPVKSPCTFPFIPAIHTCMCLFVHGCFNCLFACVQTVPTHVYMPFTTECELCWMVFLAIFCLLSGAHRVAKQWVSILQPNNMFVGRLATDMQSRCTCTMYMYVYIVYICTYAQVSGLVERPCYHCFNVLWQVRGWE